MAVAHVTVLNYLGKYVSFYISTPNLNRCYFKGVVQSVVFELDGEVHFHINQEDNFLFSEMNDLEILGNVTFS